MGTGYSSPTDSTGSTDVDDDDDLMDIIQPDERTVEYVDQPPSGQRRAAHMIDQLRAAKTSGGIALPDVRGAVADFVAVMDRLAHARGASAADRSTELPDLRTRADCMQVLEWFFAVPRTGRSRDADFRALLDGARGRMPPAQAHHWLQDVMRITDEVSVSTSLTKPVLYMAQLTDERLRPLFGHRSGVILKGQYVNEQTWAEIGEKLRPVGRKEDDSVLNVPVLSLALDFFHGRYLRELVTRWPKIATPHFATAIDAFVGPPLDLASGGQGKRFREAPTRPLIAYTITERADVTLWDALEKVSIITYGPGGFAGTEEYVLTQRMRAWLVAVCQARDAAALALGMISHNDLHPGNVMVAACPADSPYNGRAWVYESPGDRQPSDLVYVPVEAHGNWFVKIIDFGRTAFVAPDERRRPDFYGTYRSLLNQGFLEDLNMLLEMTIKTLSTTTSFVNLTLSLDDSRQWLALAKPNLLRGGWRSIPFVRQFVGRQPRDQAPMVIVGTTPATPLAPDALQGDEAYETILPLGAATVVGPLAI